MEALVASVGERGVDLLLSDMSPNLSGVDAIDLDRDGVGRRELRLGRRRGAARGGHPQ
jgi:hypothetical protein